MEHAMQDFSFSAVPTVLVEWGAARRLGELLGTWYTERDVLIVTDGGLRRSGTLDAALSSLEAAGFRSTLFDDVVADPPETVLVECVARAHAAGCDLVLGLGGGSSLDVAKLAAVLTGSPQPLSELYGIGNVRGSRLPLVQIPTTAGTGSEATNISILTTGETSKLGVVADQLFADRVLLDAELTVGLPALHTAATGIDAMVHAIEAYTSRIKKNPLSDLMAREALGMLAGNIIAACTDGTNRAARQAMLLGANLAGQAFANAPVAAVHALAYPLGGHFHVPHGLANALMLGPVLRFNATAAAPFYAELGDTLGLGGTDTAGKATAFIDYIVELLDRSGAPRLLRDVGVDAESLPMLATDAVAQQRLLANNPVPVEQADALQLYREAF